MTLSVIASSSLSPGLRGALTKWYLEVLPGIFVADVNPRIRDELWKEVELWVNALDAPAFAALIHASPTEQGHAIRTAGANRYDVIDYDGLQLIARQRTTRPNSDFTDEDEESDWADP